jgi:integrase
MRPGKRHLCERKGSAKVGQRPRRRPSTDGSTAYARQRLGAKTVLRYEQLARLHLIPTLGAIPLKALKPLQIQTAYGKITASGRSAQTALHAHRLLHGALAHAVKWQLISRNPADAVNAPRPEKREMVMLEAESLQRLIEAADRTPLGDMVHTALMTGLRFGELAGLRWGDVDLENRELHVRQVAQWLPRTGFIYKQPKTAGSARTVALPASTVERLRRHHALQLETRLMVGPDYSDNDLVFASTTGGPIDPSNLRHVGKTDSRRRRQAHISRAKALPCVTPLTAGDAHQSCL